MIDTGYLKSARAERSVYSWAAHQMQSATGVLTAGTIVALWGITLVLFLKINWWQNAQSWLIPAVLIRTFLHTGLFIVAHDAMHCAVCPQQRWLNHAIGRLAVSLYALLPYDRCFEKHWQHHRFPARSGDPDFHDGEHHGFWRWYVHFMSNYLDARQLLVLLFGMSGIFWFLRLGLHASIATVLLIWVLPICLSSLQLFYFGTYLPHREPKEGYINSHRAISSSYTNLWSFLSCYHFGYHWEHHEYPYLPWYQLPLARRNALNKR